MNKRFKIAKLMPVWIALSAAVIIVGIVLFALLGFNYQSAEKTVELTYSSVVSINEKEEDLQDICEKAFTAKNIVYSEKYFDETLNINYVTQTGETVLRYTFDESVSDDALNAAVDTIIANCSGDEILATVSVSNHTLHSESFHEAEWRGAIALAVGAIVAFIYLGVSGMLRVRGFSGSALVGFIACIHDVALTLALLAIFRIPLYAFSPVLYAALAVFLSVLLWTVQCMKMRENFKDPAYATLTAEEAVGESYKSSFKLGLIVSAVLAVLLIVLGAIATSGVRMLILPAIIPVAVCTYSSLVFTTSVFVPVKAKFDKMKAKQKRYVGKKKAEQAE